MELLLETTPAEVNTEDPRKFIEHPLLFGAGTPYPLHILDGHKLRLWVQLDENFDIELLSDESQLGEYHHEMSIFVEECGWNDVILDYHSRYETIEGHLVSDGAARWGLDNQIIPGQPFQVEVSARHYHYDTQEGTEYDCDIECEILAKHPVAPEKAAAYWANWVVEQEEHKTRIRREVPLSLAAITRHPELLYVHSDWYWSDFYDECSPPNALRLSLHTSAEPVRPDGTSAWSSCSTLAQAEDNTGNWDKAFAKLRDIVSKKYPMFADVDLRPLLNKQTAFHKKTKVPLEDVPA